jgi:hypothetical protein
MYVHNVAKALHFVIRGHISIGVRARRQTPRKECCSGGRAIEIVI